MPNFVVWPKLRSASKTGSGGDLVIRGETGGVNPRQFGTKAAAIYSLTAPAGSETVVRLRLTAESEATSEPFEGFDDVFATRIAEANAFYAQRIPAAGGEAASNVSRQAYAGLLWSKQFYHYVVKDWLDGDADQPIPPASRRGGRNHDWPHLFNRDVISMPDKWEYPWYAAWDLAFHMIPMATTIPSLPSGNWNYSYENGTSTRTDKCPPTSGRFPMSIRPFTHGLAGACIAIRQRRTLAQSAAVLRVFSRRHGSWGRREPSNRMDCTYLDNSSGCSLSIDRFRPT